jgi:hypothetical protein
LLELSHTNLDGEHGSVLSAMTPLERCDFPGEEALLDGLQKRCISIRINVNHRHADEFVPTIA